MQLPLTLKNHLPVPVGYVTFNLPPVSVSHSAIPGSRSPPGSCLLLEKSGITQAKPKHNLKVEHFPLRRVCL